jgi:RecA-family ATPase
MSSSVPSSIEYHMEKLALSRDPADKDRALKYYKDIVDRQKKTDDKMPAIFWERKTAAEIMNTDYPPIKWAVEGIIPEGLSIIVGAQKIGKSWFSLHLCTAVSHGGCFMGSIKVEQRGVLYLALEDNGRRIKDHLIKQGGMANDKLFIVEQDKWKGEIGALRSYLEEYPDTGLVMIDTLFKFMPIDETNEYSKTYKPIAELQALAIKTRIPIVLIHHTRKGGNYNNGEGWADECMGSGGINSAVDTIISLQRPDGKDTGKLRIKGRDIEEKCLDLVFDKDICTWRIVGESEVVTKGDPRAQAEVLSLLEENIEGLKTVDIADRLGKKDNAISNILKKLYDKGKVIKRGNRWIYSLFHDNSQIE